MNKTLTWTGESLGRVREREREREKKIERERERRVGSREQAAAKACLCMSSISHKYKKGSKDTISYHFTPFLLSPPFTKNFPKIPTLSPPPLTFFTASFPSTAKDP
jgi:hypothetical protein